MEPLHRLVTTTLQHLVSGICPYVLALFGGNSTIRVVPADASIVEIQIVPEAETYVSGEIYRLDAIRTDSQGYSSPVPIPIGNWTVGNGILSQVGNEVYWTPGQAGQVSLHVVDSDVPASMNVDVMHGSADATRLIASQSSVTAGTQFALVHEAIDSFGNVWQVDANISQTEGTFAGVDIFLIVCFSYAQRNGNHCLYR